MTHTKQVCCIYSNTYNKRWFMTQLCPIFNTFFLVNNTVSCIIWEIKNWHFTAAYISSDRRTCADIMTLECVSSRKKISTLKIRSIFLYVNIPHKSPTAWHKWDSGISNGGILRLLLYIIFYNRLKGVGGWWGRQRLKVFAVIVTRHS